MKFLLSAAFIFLFLIGCGGEKENEKNVAKDILRVDSSDIKTTPLDNPGQNFLMRYKLELNKDYKYRIATISNNSQTIKVDTIISQFVDENMVYLLNVKPIGIEDSIFEVVCSFNSIKIEAKTNNQTISYQSGVTKDSAELVQFSNYESLVNNPFNLRVNSTGEIIEIFKTDKIISRYLKLQNLDSINTEQKNVLREQFTQGAIRPILSQVFRKIPENNMAKDSAWTISQPPSPFLVFQLQNNNIYSVNSLEEFNDNKIAVINAVVDTKITGNTKLTEQGISYVFNKPVSEASGKIYFNVDEGCVQKSKIKSKLSITYTMEGDTPRGKQKGSRSDVIEYTNIVELL